MSLPESSSVSGGGAVVVVGLDVGVVPRGDVVLVGV